MTKDMHRSKGGFLQSYGQWFKSIGLYGQKWKWHLKVSKFDRSSRVNLRQGLTNAFLKFNDGSAEYSALEQSTGSKIETQCIRYGS